MAVPPLLLSPSASPLFSQLLWRRKQWDNLQELERRQFSEQTQQTLTAGWSQKGPGDGEAPVRQQGANDSLFHAEMALLGLAKETVMSLEL